jgi:predicted RNA-binding Zn ribbon-like protein
METPEVRELPIVGGHLALDFANTIDDPEGPARHDHIATYQGLVRWSARVGAVSPAQAEELGRCGAQDAAAALQRAHALRKSIMETFTGVATGEPAGARHWPGLRPWVAEAIAAAQLTPTANGYGLSWPGTDRPHVMLWPVAHAALDLLTAGDLHRIKRCAGCPWLFLDQSKNASRRWCAMNDCGTHAKIQRYVAKRAARRVANRP